MEIPNEVWGVDHTELDRFWYFVKERQLVWYRRNIQKLSKSKWTRNKYLRRYRFTNVYRELDRGTIWCIQNIIMKHMNYMRKANKSISNESVRKATISQYKRNMFWDIFCYRMINRVETFENIQFPNYVIWNREFVEKELYKYADTGASVFSGAYITCQSSKKQDRIHNFLDMADSMHDALPSLFKISKKVGRTLTLKDWCKKMTEVFGIGMFTAFQISLDMIYAGLLPDLRDEWADPGPGCKKGINIIFPDATASDYQDCMKFLRKTQYARLGEDFPFYNDKPIVLSDIENCLCEFSKYHSMRNGYGRHQRIF